MYTHVISLCIKGYTLFRKLICDVTHNKLYSLVITSTNKVCKCIVYILVNIIIFLYRWFYDILCVVLSFQILRNSPYPGLLQVFLQSSILGIPYPGRFLIM